VTRPTARTIHPDTALAEANRYQAAARAANSGRFDEQVIELIDYRKLLIDKHSSERPADEDPHGPFGWTHGDLQYLHWASRLLEMLLSVRIGRSARRSSWRLGWCRG
jgi:homoserine kinase type II